MDKIFSYALPRQVGERRDRGHHEEDSTPTEIARFPAWQPHVLRAAVEHCRCLAGDPVNPSRLPGHTKTVPQPSMPMIPEYRYRSAILVPIDFK